MAKEPEACTAKQVQQTHNMFSLSGFTNPNNSYHNTIYQSILFDQ